MSYSPLAQAMYQRQRNGGGLQSAPVNPGAVKADAVVQANPGAVRQYSIGGVDQLAPPQIGAPPQIDPSAFNPTGIAGAPPSGMGAIAGGSVPGFGGGVGMPSGDGVAAGLLGAMPSQAQGQPMGMPFQPQQNPHYGNFMPVRRMGVFNQK